MYAADKTVDGRAKGEVSKPAFQRILGYKFILTVNYVRVFALMRVMQMGWPVLDCEVESVRMARSPTSSYYQKNPLYRCWRKMLQVMTL